MKTALILYHSKTGITKKYAGGIAEYLNDHEVQTEVCSIADFKNSQLGRADAVFLGCWTHGLFLFLQHPDKEWVKFASGLPELHDKQVALFTTYKLATGSMFGKMKKQLGARITDIKAELRSKKGDLSEIDKLVLDDLI